MSDANTKNESTRDQPSRAAALRSLPVESNSLFGWILAATFLMPFAVGCDKQTIFTPVTLLSSRAAEAGAFGVLSECFFQWPYLYGAILSLWLSATAIVRPRRLGSWLLPLPVSFLVPITLGGAVTVHFTNAWDECLVVTLLFLLPQITVLIWLAFGMRKDHLLAATRGISGLGAIATVAIYLHAVTIFASRFLYGFYVAMGATIGLTFSAWLLYSRGEQSLCDRSLPKRPIQFRIKTMLLWTTFVAIIAAIYQLLARQE